MRSRYRYRRYSTPKSYENGHTKAAKRLSERLAGTTEIVKTYLFSLDDGDRDRVFNRYEQLHGRSKRTYAQKVFSEWKAGTRRMGGDIAARLYDLLPPLMPPVIRYEIAKALWDKFSPSSESHYRVGFDCSVQVVVGTVQHCLLSQVVPRCIPENLKRQFSWLSGNEVSVQEDLLAYLQHLETAAITADAQHRLPALLHVVQEKGGMVKQIDQTYRMGKHVVHLHFDARHTGIEPGRRLPTPNNDQLWGMLILIGVGLLLLLLFLAGSLK